MSPSFSASRPYSNPRQDEDVYDLVCVGFGPAALAIAVALHDLEIGARVLFLERQSHFAWHAGMLIPSAKMQISFLKDLATFRDPRSRFTFLNYLKKLGRLEAFANLGTFHPLREEFNAYLMWAAEHFNECVRYSTDVQSIHASCENSDTSANSWIVQCQDLTNDLVFSLVSRKIVIAVGGSPKLPRGLHSFGPKIVHSSHYLRAISENDWNVATSSSPLRFAVIGGGQSAAEIFEDLCNRFPKAQVRLFVAGSALKPSDDSPFVNEIFDPDRVNEIYALDEKERSLYIEENRPTNYSVVRPELLDRLYEKMYHQRLHEPDESQWAFQIQGSRELCDTKYDRDGRINLHFVIPKSGNSSIIEELGFDHVFVATGYLRNIHTRLLQPIQNLIEDSFSSVERDYRLRLKQDLVDPKCGIWLQGCCEASHGLSDSLLSVLAVRGGEIVNSIFGKTSKNEM